ESGAVAGDLHGVVGVQAAGGVGRADLAHGHAHDGGRLRAEGGQQVGQGDLDGGDGDLGGLGVVGLLVVGDDLQDGPAGLEPDAFVELLESGAEHRGGGDQLLDHLEELGGEADVDEHRAG